MPSLDAVYAGEGLPELAAPKPGEEKMLRQAGLDTYAQDIRKGRRVPRCRSKKQDN